MSHVTLILASASPRRKELLARLTPDFIVVPSYAEEPKEGDAAERALGAARAKAHDVASRRRGIVIGADTVVVVQGEVLGKPSSRSEARKMLARLSGREHQVITGLCVVSTWTGEERVDVVETSVEFRELTADEIERYVESGEPDDKAGAYAIQGRGGLFVDRVCGDVYNVIGLPLSRLCVLLREVGVRV